MKKLASYFIVSLLLMQITHAQEITLKMLYGKWKVKSWIFFENFNETSMEHNERMKEYNRCLTAEIIIDSAGIKVPEKNACNLDQCEYSIAKNTRYFKKRIVPDNNYTNKGQGSEMIDSNIVGKKFVKCLDENYSKSTLLLIDAGCTQSYGNFTMKICVINKYKIGLFLGEELIILERV